MGGRGASGYEVGLKIDNFIEKLIEGADKMTRGDLQNVVEAYAIRNKFSKSDEENILGEIDTRMKRRNIKLK